MMKHFVLVVLVLLYIIVWGQNWTWFAGALMLRAIALDYYRVAYVPVRAYRTPPRSSG
jgi:phosphatidylglycerophosphate synthase